MKATKKILAIVIAVLLVATVCITLVACDNEDGIKIKVWVSETEGMVELTQAQIARFNLANPDMKVVADVSGRSESKASGDMIQDMESGADIFCFAQDQLARLIQKRALAQPGVMATETLVANNDESSISSATFGGKVMAYPLTSDNGYFMIYDKTVVSEEHLESLEDILNDCHAAGKMFSMKAGTDGAWYSAAFFIGAGCHSDWETNAKGYFTDYDDTYSDATTGSIAMKGLRTLQNHPAFNNSADAADFGVNSAVVITGIWDVANAKAKLGDKFAMAPLPKFDVDGTKYQLGSFYGSKLLGVKSTKDSARAKALQALALYLTNEECQMERFQLAGWGPSNVSAQANPDVIADEALQILKQQNAFGVQQGQYPDMWWPLASNLGLKAKSCDTDSEITTALNDYKTGLAALLDA